MLHIAQMIYRKVVAAHHDVYAQIIELGEQCKKINDLEELADLAYAMRESYKYVDDLRKELNAAKEVCERIACLLWTKEGTGESIKTAFVTATPRVKMTASIPKRSSDPEAYEALMNFLKVPEDKWDVVKVHWPGFVEYTSRLIEEGLPLPDGLDPSKMYPVYALTIRGKKDVEEGCTEPLKQETQKRAAKETRQIALATRLGFKTYKELREFMGA